MSKNDRAAEKNKYLTLEQELINLFENRKGEVQIIRIKQICKKPNVFNYSIDVTWKSNQQNLIH